MNKLFRPGARDQAIDTTCQNLVMAGGILTPAEVADFMAELANYTDARLGIALVESRMLLDSYLENCRGKN